MATVTKTIVENSGSYRATWTLTITGTDRKVTGATFLPPEISTNAKYVYAGKSRATCDFNGIYTTVKSIEKFLGHSYLNWQYWPSGTAKTLTNSWSGLYSYNTSDIFNSSNKAERTINVSYKLGALWLASETNASIPDLEGQFEAYDYALGNISTVTLDVPPTFSETFTYTGDFSGVPYANLTTASVSLSDLAAYYGGDFTGVGRATFTIGSQAVTKANPANNDVLSINLQNVGAFTPTVSVTDSRGQTTTHTLNAITVQGYNAPSVSFNTERTASTGTPDDEGAYAVIDTTFTFTDAIATLSAPTVAVTDDGGLSQTVSTTWYSSRAADGTLSGSVSWANLSSGDTVYGLVSITGNFNTQKSYQIAITPQDSEGTGTTITQTLGSAFYTVDFLAGGHGIAFGQPASQAGFFCNMDANFMQDVLIDLPNYQTAGTTDKAIYDAIVALGWDSEVLV